MGSRMEAPGEIYEICFAYLQDTKQDLENVVGAEQIFVINEKWQ